jgi:hypothetical protein
MDKCGRYSNGVHVFSQRATFSIVHFSDVNFNTFKMNVCHRAVTDTTNVIFTESDIINLYYIGLRNHYFESNLK